MPNHKTNLPDSQKKTSVQPISQTAPKSFIRSFLEFVGSLIIIIIAANLIHKFIFHPFYVVGVSMEPSFQDGNYLFVEKLSYRFGSPQRCDVVVFIPPWDSQNMLIQEKQKTLNPLQFQLQKWTTKIQRLVGIPAENLDVREYIKRIIGLPGETVQINDKSQIIIKNNQNPDGFVLEESYLDTPTKGALEITLGDNEYFVLGDNRTNSSDSRGTPINGKNNNPHTVPLDSIEGKVFVRLWPPQQIGVIQNPAYNQ